MTPVQVAIGGDHHAGALKEHLAGWLRDRGHTVLDCGVPTGSAPVDYPPICADVCAEVTAGRATFGVVLGGSGSGETMACNKVRGIRATLCHDVFLAEVARGNNDANVLVLGTKVIAAAAAERVLTTWLATAFRGGEHARRLEQLSRLEAGEPLR